MNTVGTSWRTPAKHDILWATVGREVGATKSIAAIKRLVWLDLTAGNGIPASGREWARDCSPGILAHHARNSNKPLDITMYEIAPATYASLLTMLNQQLPALGYVQQGEQWWQYGQHVNLRAINQSGSLAAVDSIDADTAVLVVNDPNAITTWAMRPTFAADVAGRTRWSRSVSTMGCNPGGLKRLPPEARAGWFEHLARQEIALPGNRDLFLAAIERDSDQWAYLFNEPIVWRQRIEKATAYAFAKYGRTLRVAWYRREPEAYHELKRYLFLTATERVATKRNEVVA